MSDLSAVMGASTTVKTMADGSLRIAIDIEPRHAQTAFALFGSPGTPVALARITNEAAIEQDRKAPRESESEKPKGGPLAILAGRLCADPEFHHFASVQYKALLLSGTAVNDCAEWLRKFCGVASRAEIDGNPDATSKMQEIRGAWIKWRSIRGLS